MAKIYDQKAVDNDGRAVTLYTKYINAKPGNPSTFWSKDKQTWYRSKTEALADTKENAVNPNDYVMIKSIWDQNKKWIIVAGIILLLGAGGFWLWHHGNITFHLHKPQLS